MGSWTEETPLHNNAHIRHRVAALPYWRIDFSTRNEMDISTELARRHLLFTSRLFPFSFPLFVTIVRTLAYLRRLTPQRSARKSSAPEHYVYVMIGR